MKNLFVLKKLVRIFLLAFLFCNIVFVNIGFSEVVDSPIQAEFDENLEYVESEVVVKLKENKVDLESYSGDVVLNGLEIVNDVESQKLMESENLVLMQTGNDENTDQLIQKLEKSVFVEYAEPNFVRSLNAVPNDSLFNLQWGHNNTGQIVDNKVGTADADVDAPEAYDIFTGSGDVVVAVLDSGILRTHDDLAANLWDGSSSCRDESNSVIAGGCPNNGWDFVNNDNNPADDNGHGTFVAGVISGKGNNTKGITGVNPNGKIMTLKMLNGSGLGTVANEIKSINFAKNNGADIINASYGGGSFSQAEKDAIDNFGGLFIAAAGNGGSDGIGDDNDSTPHYPSSYSSSNVIAVAASNQNDSLTGFSNFGVSSVDIAAPGENIVSTHFSGKNVYAIADGTSFSAPYVSGAASLLWSANANLNVEQVKALLLDNGDILPSLSGKVSGARRLNLFSSLDFFDPIGGFDEENVIPEAQISQLDNGLIAIPFRVSDSISGVAITLNSFEYSVDGGINFSALHSVSEALGTNWNKNNYVAGENLSGDVYTFSLNPKHADFLGLGVDQNDVVVRFKVSDGAKNSAFVTSEAFRVDAAGPEVSGLFDDSVAKTSKTFNWDAEEGATFRFNIDQNVNGAPGGDYSLIKTVTHDEGNGTFYIHVQAKDTLGNEGPVVTSSFIMDSAGADILGLSDDSIAVKSKTWSWEASEDGVTFRSSIDQNVNGVPSGAYGDIFTATQPNGDGMYYLHVQSKDALGNESEVITVSAILDNMVPVINGLIDSDIVTNSKFLSWGADDASAVSYTFVIDQDLDGDAGNSFSSVNNTTHASGNGIFYIHIQAKDQAGNLSDVTTASFVIDTLGPDITGLSNDVGPIESKIWNWNSSDAGASFRFVIDQNESGVPDGDFSDVQTASLDDGEGIYYIHVQARDALGNLGEVTTASVVMDTAPVISGVSDDLSAVKSKVWTWDSNDAAAKYRFVVDQDLNGLPTSNYSTLKTASLDAVNGTFYVHVQAIDETGHESAVMTGSVILDNIAPSVILSNLPSDSTSATAAITVGGAEVTHYKYRLDGADFSAEFPINFTLNISGLSVGNHSIVVIGRDLAGNYQVESSGVNHSWAVQQVVSGGSSNGGGDSGSVNTSPVPSSGGGGGGGGGGSSNFDDEESSVSTPELSEDLLASSIEIPKNTVVKDKYGNIYKGSIAKPLSIPEQALPKEMPSNLKFTAAVDIATEGHVIFDKNVKISISIPEDLKNLDKQKIYYYDDNKDAYVLAGDGGEISEDSQLAIVEIDHLTLFVVAEYQKPFNDVAGHWAEEFVLELNNLGVVQGRVGSLFDPDSKLTRAELTKIALLTFDYEMESEDGEEFTAAFKDVKEEDWFYRFIAVAQHEGIVGGYNDGTFRPNVPVTRSEAVKILLKAAKIENEDIIVGNFSDVRVGDWFYAYVNLAFDLGIVNGKANGIFKPNDLVTRAEMAKIAIKALKIEN